MSENRGKQYVRALALFLFIVVLPIGSYYYLSIGRQFYRENLAMIQPKATVSPFSFQSLSGDTISSDQFTGKVWVASFLETPCNTSCEQQLEHLKVIQDAFYKTGRASILSFHSQASDLIFESEKTSIDGAERGFWYASTLGDSLVGSIQHEFFAGRSEGFDGQYLVLLDDSLRVRKYYPAIHADSIELLIRHMAMIMPKEKKREIGFEREKEK